jgi:hypothetical protein
MSLSLSLFFTDINDAKTKKEAAVFIILGSDKMIFPSLKTLGYEFLTSLFKFVAKRLKSVLSHVKNNR